MPEASCTFNFFLTNKYILIFFLIFAHVIYIYD